LSEEGNMALKIIEEIDRRVDKLEENIRLFRSDCLIEIMRIREKLDTLKVLAEGR